MLQKHELWHEHSSKHRINLVSKKVLPDTDMGNFHSANRRQDVPSSWCVRACSKSRGDARFDAQQQRYCIGRQTLAQRKQNNSRRSPGWRQSDVAQDDSAVLDAELCIVVIEYPRIAARQDVPSPECNTAAARRKHTSWPPVGVQGKPPDRMDGWSIWTG